MTPRGTGPGRFQRVVHVLAAPDRELRFELGGALAQHPAVGLPGGAVGHVGREVALALSRRSRVALGERQALALEGQRRGIARPTPQEAAGRPLEFSDAPAAASALRCASVRALRAARSWSARCSG